MNEFFCYLTQFDKKYKIAADYFFSNYLKPRQKCSKNTPPYRTNFQSVF